MNSLKCQTCIIKVMNAFLYNIGKPDNKIINKYEEIEKICKNNKEQILSILYFNKKNKINDILYGEDKIIDIKVFDIKHELSKLYYLSLIVDNSKYINYFYPFDFINNLSDYSIKEKSFIIQIFMSKIIIILVDNAKGLDYYKQYKNELEKINNRNIEIIKSNLKIFNKEFNLKYDINSFLNKEIDSIYTDIIISLINKYDFNNYEYYKDIFGKLNLEAIDIRRNLLENISKAISIESNRYLEKYKINEDSNVDQKVINFYEILFKFVLKDSFYLVDNKFLVNNLIQLTNIYTKIHNKLSKEKRSLKSLEKIYKKLEMLKANTFFNNLSISEDIDNSNKTHLINSIQPTYNFSLENNSDYKDISSIYFNNKNTKIDVNIAREILTKIKIVIKINYCLHYLSIRKSYSYGNDYLIKEGSDFFLLKNYNYDDIKEGNYEEKKIYKKYKQFIDFLDEMEKYILNSKICFDPTIYLDLKKKIFKSGDFDMDCVYSFINPLNKREIKFTDTNILARGINGKNIGLVLLVNELCENEYEGVVETSVSN